MTALDFHYHETIKDDVEDEATELLSSLLPETPPSFPVPKGADPLKVLDIAKANRRLREGTAPARVALDVAIARAIRAHGWRHVVAALFKVEQPKMGREYAARKGEA